MLAVPKHSKTRKPSLKVPPTTFSHPVTLMVAHYYYFPVDRRWAKG